MLDETALAGGAITALPKESAVKLPLLCFSHLRWNFVFQRPQHLMSRFAKSRNVIFFEEPTHERNQRIGLKLKRDKAHNVTVATPELPAGLSPATERSVLRELVHALVEQSDLHNPVLWYYTPLMRRFSSDIKGAAIVYDCMDELANFRFAPKTLQRAEAELLAAADVVFTGGYSLYEAKRQRHENIHPFPSSVDAAHFARARERGLPEAPDQAALPHPRLGFFGVIDERMDCELLAELADARPEWSIVIVGPVVKIAPSALPRRKNLHFLGPKSYSELPLYLAGWDAALMPFALNEATRFISPTKTPEYLCGGKPVVSTAITDVARHYGDLKGVRIASSHAAFIAQCDAALSLNHTQPAWLAEADAVLSLMSWDSTFERMDALVDDACVQRLRQRAD